MLIFLTGCSSPKTPDSRALTTDFEGKTGSGIGVGSSYEEWVSSYRDYHIQEFVSDNLIPYTPDPVQENKKDDEEAPVTHSGRFMVSSFFVDNNPTSVEELLLLTGADTDTLTDSLSDPGFLSEHSVVYRYIIFTIEDDIITDIENDYLDYNQEL